MAGPTSPLTPLLDEAESLAADLRGPGETPSGFPAVRPGQLAPLLRSLEQVAAALGDMPAGFDGTAGERTLALCDAVLRDPGGRYDPVRNRLWLIAARVHLAREDWPQAGRAIAPLVFQPHVAGDDIGSVREAMLLDRTVRANLVGASAGLAALFVERLLFLLSRSRTSEARREALAAFQPQLAACLADPATVNHVARVCGVSESMLLELAAPVLALRATGWPARHPAPPATHAQPRRREARSPPLLAQLEAAAAGRRTFALSPATLDREAAPVPTHACLVTRAMGGAGDIATMIPGVVASAIKRGRPVHFAVPRVFLQLIRGIPEIVPLASEDPLGYEDFAEWINFSECPASRVESATAPNVTKGRVEIFANALGMGADDLDRSGWTARFRLDQRQHAAREALRRAARDRGRLLVGIAPFSREEYKSTRALIAAADRLAEEHQVLVLHPSRPPALAASDLQMAATPDLASLMAVIAACDYLVTIDTVHVHLAGALGTPTLAIFGPTDGRLVTRHHPSSVLLQPWRNCTLMPCWRHEDSDCELALGPVSLCLRHLSMDEILEAFARLRRTFPIEIGADADTLLPS